jgi:hypothetical protein
MANGNAPANAAGHPYFRSAEFKDVYSNNVRIAASPLDFTMMFGRLTELGGVTSLEDVVHTRLSPYQFKILVKQVVSGLEAWEEVFGNIPVNLPEIKKETMVEALTNMKNSIKGSVS